MKAASLRSTRFIMLEENLKTKWSEVNLGEVY